MSTSSMENRAAQALRSAWDAIAYDTLQAFADDQGIKVDRVIMSREDVIDCVTSCGFVGGYPETYGNDKEAVTWLDKQPRGVQTAVCFLAFPHKRYGT